MFQSALGEEVSVPVTLHTLVQVTLVCSSWDSPVSQDAAYPWG
jgi:hypothetical protein